MGNIIGEGFPPEIIKQIETRQKIYGSGFNGKSRTSDEITYLNANTAWCKLVSSTIISGSSLTNSPTINQLVINGNLGEDKLAERFILFNGTATQTGNSGRAGIDVTNTSLGYNAAYGIGGTDFGINPMPGIQSVNVKHKNRGSIRTATVKIKAFNKTQFEIVDILYLRLGFSVLLEWGNAMYFDEKGTFQKNADNSLAKDFLKGSDYIDFLAKIQNQRIRSVGNYDAMFGKVTNFHWSFLPDGSYDITLDLISAGDVIESFKLNSRPTFNQSPPAPNANLPKSIIESQNKHIIGQIFYQLAVEINTESSLSSTKQIAETLPKDVDINNNPSKRIKAFKANYKETGLSDPIPQFYIRLGSLLYIIENEVLYKLKGSDPNSTPKPILNFDYYSVDSTLMNLLVEKYNPKLTSGLSTARYEHYPVEQVLHQVSYDPFVCLAVQQIPDVDRLQTDSYFEDARYYSINSITHASSNNGWTYNPGSPSAPSNADIFELTITDSNDVDEFGDPITHTYGKILNLYLNMDYVLNIFNLLLDEATGKIPLIDFFKKLLDGINGAFGGINALDIVIDESSNIAKIIDKNPPANYKALLKRFNLNEDTAEFSLYGYTKYTNPNTLAGSSQAGFITDFRFTTELTPEFSTMISVASSANGQAVGEDSTALSKLNSGVYDRYKKEILDTNIPPPPATVGGYTDQNLSNFLQAAFTINPPGYQPAYPSTYGEMPKSFYQFLSTLYGFVSAGTDYTRNHRYWTKEYCETFKAQIQNIYRYYYKWRTNEPPTINSGFIPFNLSLTMDGLSGMKIYQKYRVNSDFMPSNYPESMEFLIKNIEHKIEDNKWTTVLESFCISKPSQGKPQTPKPNTSGAGSASPSPVGTDFNVTPTYRNKDKRDIIELYGWPIILTSNTLPYTSKVISIDTGGRNVYQENPDYAKNNLVKFTYKGKIVIPKLHKIAVDPLTKALTEVEKAGLLDYAKNIQSGIYTRDTTDEPGNLSGHAFGLSIDVNPDRFPRGNEGFKLYNNAIKDPKDPLYNYARVIKIFADTGLFYWGYKFTKTKDTHHFSVGYNI